MRFANLLKWDMKFQARYGFYLLYGFLTLIYFVVLFSLPVSWKENTAAILIFSDPAAMGLFFMGAIVLLEKSQRLTAFFAITPLKAFEYVSSKVISLGLIGVLVATILGIASGSKSLISEVIGTFLSSSIFTLLGVIVATKITSLNQFILATVPVEVIGFVPALLHLFGVTPSIGKIYPANTCMDLIAVRGFSIPGLLITVICIILLFIAAHKCVLKMWQSQGGVKI